MRLVKIAADQWIASARCRDSAWLETSMTTASSPAASMSAKVRCRSMASGVVRATACCSPPTIAVTVPSRPVLRPPASSTARTRKADVVLPLVPVIPTVVSRAVGSPASAAAAGAIAARTSSTRTSGTAVPSGRCTTRATAPRAIASPA